MSTTEALRYLAHEGRRCRDKDTAEAICLLLPAMCCVFAVKPMDDFQALEFHVAFREELARVKNIPLAEARCEQCGQAEAVRSDLFHDLRARTWCDFCQREMWFARNGVAAGS